MREGNEAVSDRLIGPKLLCLGMQMRSFSVLSDINSFILKLFNSYKHLSSSFPRHYRANL